RKWAESGCTNNNIEETILAPDYQGTAPNGERHNKAQAMEQDDSRTERDCKLDDAKVRFFGKNLAMVYGSEHATIVPKDGKETQRCLVWTETWLRRDGKWQIIAAQDTAVKCK